MIPASALTPGATPGLHPQAPRPASDTGQALRDPTLARPRGEVLPEPERPPQLVDVEALLGRPRSLGVLDLGE